MRLPWLRRGTRRLHLLAILQGSLRARTRPFPPVSPRLALPRNRADSLRRCRVGSRVRNPHRVGQRGCHRWSRVANQRRIQVPSRVANPRGLPRTPPLRLRPSQQRLLVDLPWILALNRALSPVLARVGSPRVRPPRRPARRPHSLRVNQVDSPRVRPRRRRVCLPVNRVDSQRVPPPTWQKAQIQRFSPTPQWISFRLLEVAVSRPLRQ